jgi:ferredoxin
MIHAVIAAAGALHWPRSRVHVESFGVDEDGPRAAFRAVLSRTERSIEVSPQHTLLEALELAGLPVGSMCRQGVCGECRLPVTGGSIDHRDLFLSPEERASGQWIMPCVSRAAGEQLELTLLPASARGPS